MKPHENENNDHFLADWLSGKITDADLENKIGPDEYQAYRSLRDSLDRLQMSEPDLARNYASVKQKKIASLDRKPVRNWSVWFAAAAALLLFFGIYEAFVFSNQQTTAYGTIAGVELPDGSNVVVGANSQVRYPSLFALNRTVRLDGQAFFKVRKGQTFTVETSQGKVQVLGTQFSVSDRGNCFEVVCYEGRVKVGQKTQSMVIGKGEAIRFYRNQRESWTFETDQPEWLQNSTTFKNAPLESVFAQLQNQYGRDIDYPDALRSVRFTGSITHQNLENALRSVCIPLQMQYHVSPDGKIKIAE